MSELGDLQKRDDELAAQINAVDREISALRERQREFARMHREVRERYKILKKFASMSDEDKRNLSQLIAAEGIKSEEGVGTPGG